MKEYFLGLVVCLTILAGKVQSQQQLHLWYRQPASSIAPDNTESFSDDSAWIKALPLGNGNIGAMVFGDVNTERVQLNEKTLWSGSVDDNDNPDAPAHLEEIRRLLFAGKFKEATDLTNKTQVCKGKGSGFGNGSKVPFGSYQTLGDLRLDFNTRVPYQDYFRDLDLERAVATVKYTQNNIRFTREYFVSGPANALVIRISANKKNAINLSASLDRPERFTTSPENSQLVMKGTLDNGKGEAGMEYMARLKAKTIGGEQTIAGNKIIVTKADEVLLFLTASTDYLPDYPVYKGRDYSNITKQNLDIAFQRSYAKLLEEHIRDHQQYFNRVYLHFNGPSIKSLPTDELLTGLRKTGSSPQLAELYFHYGRYLLIASTRENTLPANLQGIWCNKIQAPWNGDYHTNINVQMNYWPAEVTNLGDLHLSLTNFIRAIEKPATRSATIQFGMKGWCINPIVNVWGFTSPGEHPSWGLTSGASGWIAQHLWQHYEFTLDKKYLASVYPTLKELARFYLDWLVKDPATGKLVSGPASSPENTFLAPDGSNGTISMGPSHDQQIIEEVFTNVIVASTIVNDSDNFIAELVAAKDNLLKTKIGPDGRLQEWAQPYKELEPGHRHFSHLYALHPGNAITISRTPTFAEAAKKTLEHRLQNGGAQTGWSAAWVVNFWSRLKNGNGALNALNIVLKDKSADNLFNLHPPFQIDGNFGATAGIAEMLLQSHEGFIELLPALPDEWKQGEVRGLCGRGGFVIQMKWQNNKLQQAQVLSKKGGDCIVNYRGRQIKLSTVAGKNYTISAEQFNASPASSHLTAHGRRNTE